jgi:ankyrin repeat protein
VVLAAAPGDLRLVDAVKAGNAAAVQKLLAARAPVNEPEADGMTALHWAVRQDSEALVRQLLRAGATASAANRYGVTPLALAAVNGNPKTTELLLAAGANPNAIALEGETVLMTAARTGNAEVVDRLIAAGARIDDTEKWRGETALMWAAGENNAAAAKALIAHGANINAQSRQIDYPEMRLNLSFMATTELPRGGFSPVMFAAREGALDSARVLADAKANLDLQDPEGTTALMLAIMNVHYDVALMLVEKGANPNVYDKAGDGCALRRRGHADAAAADQHAAAQAVQRRGFARRRPGAPETRRRRQCRAEDDAAAAPSQHGGRLAWRGNHAADACGPVRRCGGDAGADRGGCRCVEAAAKRKYRVAVCVRRRIPNRRRRVCTHGQGE